VMPIASRSQQAQQRRLQGADKVEAKQLKAQKAAEADRANANAALGNAFNRAPGEAPRAVTLAARRVPLRAACCDAWLAGGTGLWKSGLRVQQAADGT
jgi:hypothetical protein